MSRKSIFEKIILWNREKDLISPNSKILVGFSGGPDSTFLLWSLNELRKVLKISDLHAVHINHQLRGEESERDEKFSRNFTEKLGVGFTSFRVEVEKLSSEQKISTEDAARKLRYQKFEELRERLGFDLIATAHNSTDFAETLVFNLVRGIDRENLSGIPAKRGKIIRPILPISKKEILEILESEKIGFVIDSSNLENDYSRNKIRNQIFPLIREINPGFERKVFENFSQDLEEDDLAKEIVKLVGFDGAFYDLVSFNKLKESTREKIIRDILENFRESTDVRISRKLVENAVKFLSRNSSGELILSSSSRLSINLILIKQETKFTVLKNDYKKEKFKER